MFRLIQACIARQHVVGVRRRLGAVGPNVEISADLHVDSPERARLGDWIYVGPYSHFYARGGLIIDDHTIIGPRVTIMTSMHNYHDAKYVPYDEVELLETVDIGMACWIGFGAIIMPGVVLGKGCIVAAGAVVTSSFDDGAIIGGNPARLIKMRNLQHLENCLALGHTYLKTKVIQKLVKEEQRHAEK